MTEKIDLQHGLGRKEIKSIKRRFRALNTERLKRLESELNSQQKDFLTLIPLLFHINHATLPGYTSNEAPAGMADYKPDRKTLLIAKKLGRSFEYKRRALRTIPIQGLYLMGSIGTIGQTPDSDLDFWLCHNHDLTEEQLEQLQKKAHLIERYGMERGLEVHIFLMDAVAFKSGQRLTISSESSGSSQHHLLLEEFYRTGILLAGRSPLWWIIPPEEEDNYLEYSQNLITKRFINPADWLDFGGMDNIPAEEFFGVAHWQLYKGIESPYKAILKILLMESYAADFPNISWLSHVTKQAIFNGDDDVIDIDPYVLIYRQVEAYLSSRLEDERLELARRCFYFKVNLPLSRPARTNQQWKQQKLSSLVKEWQWSEDYIRRLDSRDRWKLEEVIQERNILVRELTHSYRVLMNFARNKAATGGIDPLELNLLGRKLYAALERRPGKIDFINPGISKDLHESRLCFRYDIKNDQEKWQLYRDDPFLDQRLQPLKNANSLVELLAWCHSNKTLEPGIQIIIRPYTAPVNLTELRHILDLIQQNIPDHNAIKPELEQLEHKPQTSISVAFINIGLDPLDKLSKAGLQLTSKRSDPLSFSSGRINLCQRIEYLVVNTWGEIEVFSWSGTQGLLESLCRHLQSIHKSRNPKHMAIHGFGSARSHNIASRVEQLSNNLIDCFLISGTGLNSKYVLEIGDRFACIFYVNESFRYLLFDDQQELFDQLGETSNEFQQVVFDEQALRKHPLPEIFRHNRPDIIQLFTWQLEKGTQLFILDENGCLFHQFMRNADEQHLLMQQQRFLESLANRRTLLSVDNASKSLNYVPEYYRMEKSERKEWLAIDAHMPDLPVSANYTELELLVGNGSEESLSSYSILCDDQEFDYLILRDDIYVAVAGYILNIRKHAATYPVYLTAIAPTGMERVREWSTIHMLNFKKKLENQVNIALRQLAYKH